MHDWHAGSCCHLTRPLQLFRLLEHFEQDCYLCTQRCCCTIYCSPCSFCFKHLLELQVLPVNYTPAEMTLHATLIAGLSEMLSSLLRSSSSALLVWYPLAPGCLLCSTPDCCFGCQPHRILLPLNPPSCLFRLSFHVDIHLFISPGVDLVEVLLSGSVCCALHNPCGEVC